MSKGRAAGPATGHRRPPGGGCGPEKPGWRCYQGEGCCAEEPTRGDIGRDTRTHGGTHSKIYMPREMHARASGEKQRPTDTQAWTQMRTESPMLEDTKKHTHVPHAQVSGPPTARQETRALTRRPLPPHKTGAHRDRHQLVVSKGTRWPLEDWDGGRGCPRALCSREWERTKISFVILFLRARAGAGWTGIAFAGGGGVLKAARGWGLGKISGLGKRRLPILPPPLSQGGRCYFGKVPPSAATFPTEGWGPWARQRQSHSFVCKRKHRGPPCLAWGWRGPVSVGDSARAESGGQCLSLEH